MMTMVVFLFYPSPSTSKHNEEVLAYLIGLLPTEELGFLIVAILHDGILEWSRRHSMDGSNG